MKTNKILLTIIIIGVSACNQSSKVKSTVEVSQKKDIRKLLSRTKKEFKIAAIEREKDTLGLVILNKSIYYPFGKAKAIDKLEGVDSHFVVSEETTRDKYSEETFKLYKFQFKKSYLKFFKSTESNLLEITSGDISEKEIMLPRNIHIGMTLADLVQVYFSDDVRNYLTGIRVVKLISGVDGIWEYYKFDNGKLTSIQIKTDYTFESN